MCNPCVLKVPQSKGDKIRIGCPRTKQEGATSSLPSRRPKRGRNCYVIPAFWGVLDAKRGEKFRRGYLTHAFLGAQKRAELVCNPCVLKVPQSKGDKIRIGCPRTKQEGATSSLPSRRPKRGRNCYVIPAFWGVLDAKRGEKFRRGYLTHAFLGAQKRAELQNQNWLPHPCRLGGPKGGGIAV